MGGVWPASIGRSRSVLSLRTSLTCGIFRRWRIELRPKKANPAKAGGAKPRILASSATPAPGALKVPKIAELPWVSPAFLYPPITIEAGCGSVRPSWSGAHFRYPSGPMAELPPGLATALQDRYRLDRELGQGGMATVYLAHDLRNNRPVALKVLRPELAALLGRERFLAEIRLTAKLDHPNVMTLLDSGDAGGVLYYALPYVRGGSLRQHLDEEGRLSIEETTRIVSQIASALDHAHAQGVIHRDIKPENILLHEGVPMLTDFGIALAVREAGGERLTETGLVVGTPQYMSPEQATGDRLLDARSDLYSLGAVAYEMLAGEPPVLGGSAQAIIAKLITERPTPLRVMRDQVPDGIARAVERALAKVPADRFRSGAEFVKALNAPTVAHPHLRRHALAAAGGALIVGVAMFAGKWVADRRTHPPLSSSMIAVLPFAPSTADSALSKLGRDLVLTLSANLTGAGEIRAVDAQTVLGQVGGAVAARSRSQDLALGRRLGAGGVARGTLVRVGADVRWDVDLISSEDGQLLAQASTTAAADSIRAFTDTATRSLLRQIWMRGQAPSRALTSPSRLDLCRR